MDTYQSKGYPRSDVLGLSKNPTEVDTLEIYHVLGEIKHTLDNLDIWSRPKKVDAPITMFRHRSFIQYEPRGVVLVISPWNYPFSLCVGPLVSALAAGNAAVLKPSEFTPHVAALISKMVKEIFDPAIVSCFEGGPDVSTRLLKLPFDHIFFTGSPAVGKVVMMAAAENLTSVTLELGGKSPVIITNGASSTMPLNALPLRSSLTTARLASPQTTFSSMRN
jgi:aldehyde dehydrogenase (NAD+)